MTLTKEQQKLALIASVSILVLLNGYRFLTGEKPKTAPLVYTRGAVATSLSRPGLQARPSGADPLNLFFEKRDERFTGVVRNLFKMENPVVARPKSMPTVAVAPPPPPAAPERTAEQIAADAARSDLSKFKFLGYLTEKDTTLFLSKDGELFIVKSGGIVLKYYKVKEAYKDYVVLQDTVTHVEMRVGPTGELTAAQQLKQELLQPQQQKEPSPSQAPNEQPKPLLRHRMPPRTFVDPQS